jgi:hypothetical protein
MDKPRAEAKQNHPVQLAERTSLRRSNTRQRHLWLLCKNSIGDIHSNTAGYRVIAQAFQQVLA